MRKLIPALLLGLCTVPLLAKDKAQAVYQEGTLVSFRTVATGISCDHRSTSDSQTSGSVDDDGSVAATTKGSSVGDSSCVDREIVQYTVSSEGHTYVLRPQPRAWNRASVLHGQLPGAKVEIRMSRKGGIYIRVVGKESRFDLVEAK